jgi:hypothetical protein
MYLSTDKEARATLPLFYLETPLAKVMLCVKLLPSRGRRYHTQSLMHLRSRL